MRRVDAERAQHEARTAEQAHEIAELLGKTVLRFEVKAGPTGSLFGSVTPSDVADEIWRTRKVRIDRRKIGIDPIKRIGRFTIPIELFQDVQVEVKTLVVPEGGELPPEEELAALEAAESRGRGDCGGRGEAEHAGGRVRDRRAHRGRGARGGGGAAEAAEDAEQVVPEPAAELGGGSTRRRGRGTA